jgi:stage II sporulation protein D
MDAFPRGVWLCLALLPLIVLPMACSPRQGTTPSLAAPTVRVRLLNNVDRVTLQVTAAPLIRSADGSSKRLKVQSGRTVTVVLAGGQWQFNDVSAGDGVLTIEPAEPGSVSVNNLPYRGNYRLVPTGADKFDIVNDVDIESYLRGVLAKELFPDWHASAYNAQAVIARTYALYEARTNPPGRHWDLFPDTRSQVYGGMRAETERADAAVDLTRGVVVTWGPENQERIFKAFFSSCCGGVTAAAGDVFGGSTIPPLEARYNGNTCSISTRYNWGPVTVAKSELTRRAKVWGERMGHPIGSMPGLATIDIASVNAFGRPRGFVVTDTAGKTYTLTAEQMRWVINADADGRPTVYSSFFRPIDAGKDVQFIEGHGFGHGTGACQWCMQARAQRGEPYEEIVLSQFPQAKVLLAY